MPVDIIVPQLGESIVEATVVKWFKSPGDQVTSGEALLELETEKVTLEVNATNDGILSRIEAKEGEDVKIGDLLGVLDGGAGDASASAGDSDEASTGDGATVDLSSSKDGTAKASDDRITPIARRMAAEAGIGQSEVEGTGTSGRILREDVERAVASRDQARQDSSAGTAATREERGDALSGDTVDAPDTAGSDRLQDPGADSDDREEVIPMSRRRRTIASRLVEAQHTAAILTTFNEIDMTNVMTIRKRNQSSFEKRHGVRLGFMSFFVKAVIGALKDFPELNAEIRDGTIVYKNYYDIGIAVGAEEGLVVPALRDADRLTFAEIERNIRTFAAKASEGTLSLSELRGGTFTISNGGVYGSMLSTPILNPPQVGILGMHRIDDRPVAIDGQVVIRPMMYVALSYDHRIVDGREAVQFLVRVKSLVEVPSGLLLGV